MKLPESAVRRFEEIGPQIHAKKPVIVCKFYSLCGYWAGYATEYYPKPRVYYGYVVDRGMGCCFEK